MHVNHVHEVSQILAQNATATNANKPVERLHLTNSEDQHIKMIAQQVERDEQHYFGLRYILIYSFVFTSTMLMVIKFSSALRMIFSCSVELQII